MVKNGRCLVRQLASEDIATNAGGDQSPPLPTSAVDARPDRHLGVGGGEAERAQVAAQPGAHHPESVPGQLSEAAQPDRRLGDGTYGFTALAASLSSFPAPVAASLYALPAALASLSAVSTSFAATL